jgi:hypothetical protein
MNEEFIKQVAMGHHMFTLAELALRTLSGDTYDDIPSTVRYPVCARAMQRYRALEKELDQIDLEEYNAMKRALDAFKSAAAGVDVPCMRPLPDPTFQLRAVGKDISERLSRSNVDDVKAALASLESFDVPRIVAMLERLDNIHNDIGVIEDSIWLMISMEDINVIVDVLKKEDNVSSRKRQWMVEVMLNDYDRTQRMSTTASWISMVALMMRDFRSYPYFFLITDFEEMQLNCKVLKFSEFAARCHFQQAGAPVMSMVDAMVDWVTLNDPLTMSKMYFS